MKTTHSPAPRQRRKPRGFIADRLIRDAFLRKQAAKLTIRQRLELALVYETWARELRNSVTVTIGFVDPQSN